MNKILRLSIPFILACLLLGMLFYLVGASNQALASEAPDSKWWAGKVLFQKKDEPQNTLEVTTLQDELNDDGDCSLREAIIAANTDSTVDDCSAGNGMDTIILPAGNYTLTIPGSGEDLAATGDLDITDDAIILGAGYNDTVINGNGPILLDRIFQVDPLESGISVTLSRVTIQNGNASSEDGGGIHNRGSLTLDAVTVISNTGLYGGGIYNEGTLVLEDTAVSRNSGHAGAGITHFGGTLTLTHSTINNNDGNGIYSQNISGLVSVTLIDSNLINNNDDGFRGINTPLSITGGSISGNGAGIFCNCVGPYSLKNVTISGNTNRGINIVNVESGLLENITISGNSTSGDGAGLYYWGLMGTMTMTNVTISGNSAGGNGGGFMADSGIQSHLILNNVTISGNTAANGGGIYNNSDTIFKNTIVAGNTNNNCAGGNPITSNGYNLDSGNTCAFSNTGDLSNTDPLLGPLQDNGGPTWTHALLWGSPAIDTGDDAQCPPTDQRGVHRPLDGDGDGNPICDIGSYELEGPPVSPTLVTISGSSGGLVGQAYTFTASTEPVSTTLPITYTWQADDHLPIIHTGGLTDTVSFTWDIPGTQIITVTTSNLSGSVIDTHVITITDIPISGLTAFNDSPTLLGEATTFTAVITSGTNISYTWDFGDSQFGSGETITHTYADHGLYTTTVTATNSVSWQAATTLVTIIPPNYPEYIPIIFNYFEREFQPISPTKVIITGPDEGLVGQGFSFTASVIPIFTTLPITYTWQTDEQTPVTHTGGVTDVISFTWDTAGLQLVTVSASNRYGSASASHVIMISDLPISGLSVSNDSPTQLGKTTTFTATTISGTNVIFDWDFGDGVKDSGQIVTHTYSATGWYTATITATNSATQLTDTTRVKIIDVPIHGLSASNDSPTDRGFATTFTATVTSGTNVIYTWNFGDNKTGSGRIITHTYTKAGNYTAKVSATNSNSSLSDTTEVTITVPHYQFYFPLVPKYSQSSPDANLAFSIPDSGVLMGLAYDGSMGMWKNK